MTFCVKPGKLSFVCGANSSLTVKIFDRRLNAGTPAGYPEKLSLLTYLSALSKTIIRYFFQKGFWINIFFI